MSAAVQGTDVVLALKKQSGLGTPATGSGATGIEVRPSQGLQIQVAQINSAIIRRNLMRKKPRPGSQTVTTAYETELQDGNLNDVYAAVLGGSIAPITITQADVTSLAITGTGTVATVGSGSLLTLGLRSGMWAKLSGMATSGNNGVWFPILDPTATTFAIPAGYLVDETADTSFSLVTAQAYSTPTPRPVEYYTVEEYLGAGVDFSKVGSDQKFTSLAFDYKPNAPITVSFGLTGLQFTTPSGASAPQFTSPVFPTTTESLVMLDGALYNGVTPFGSLTGLTMGISAQASVTPLLNSRVGTDVVLGMFDFAGNIVALIEDSSLYAAFVAQTPAHLLARMSTSDLSHFVAIYVGDACYGGPNAPIADGQMLQTVPIYAGSDGRGAGYNDTTMLISVSN